MKKRSLALAFLGLFIAAMVVADEPSALERRKEIIRYGIESEILELVSALQTEKEDGFNGDLLNVLLESRSPKLRESLLKFFSAREWDGAISAAIDILDRRDQEAASSVMAALSYLAAVKAKDGIPEAREILAEQETKYMPMAVRLLGRAGGPAEAESLLTIFEADETTEALKQDAILALGEIKAQAAVERLIGIVEDESSGKATRMYAADSLGKIGDARAIPALVKAANGEDPQVRSYAINALGSFSGSEAQSAIVQGLRDSVPGVRLAAVRSASSLKIREAEPYIRYRARNDPDKKVRQEAIKALGEFGGHENLAFLREYVQDKKADSGSRVEAFSTLMERDGDGSRGVLQDVLASESAGKDTATLKAFLRVLSLTEQKSAAPLVETYLLKSADFTMRIAGIDWVRKNKVSALRPLVSAMAETDKVEAVKKRAAGALEDF